MTIEADLWTAASAHLEPGEQIQAVFPALRSAPWKLFGVDGVHNYAVVATDRRIAVFRTSKWKLSTVDALLDELPRSPRYGSVRSMPGSTGDSGARCRPPMPARPPPVEATVAGRGGGPVCNTARRTWLARSRSGRG